MTRKQEERVARVLFQERLGTKCDLQTISKRTGIPVTSLYRYRKNPDAMPLGRVMQIATALRLDEKDSAYLLTGKGA